MIRKGIISSLPDNKARVTIPDMDPQVTYMLSICAHVTDLHVGDIVVVVFWGPSLADGAIIGKVI